MITSIHYLNFKALSDFTIHLKEFNILTGPNNNGKSTLLDGLRVLQAAHRYSSRYNPRLINSPFGKDQYGYEIPPSSIPIILDNIQTDFNTTDPAVINFKFSQGQALTIYFHAEHPIYLLIDTPRRMPLTASAFKKEFAINVSIIPTLGPLETEEELLESEYVKRWYGSRRSPRMFRSYWYYNNEHFLEFKKLVESTWNGMSISPPERKSTFSKELMMFCEENRMAREICWAGFGFQIWLQLLTHIVSSKNSDLLVVDEPEIYLHPDLQHKVLDLLKESNAKIVLATHSVEIINTVEPSDVLLVDKKNKHAKRVSDLIGLQGVSNILGSGQNIQLTRLARGKKILFVEGKDLKLLNRLSKICHKNDLFATGEITVIPIDGFSQHDKIIHTNWAFTKVLGEELKIAVLLDRDYRADEEIDAVKSKLRDEISLAHILSKKELENYYLVPNAIEKAINQKLDERISSGTLVKKPKLNIDTILLEQTEKLKTETLSQLAAHKAKIHQKSGKDISTTITEVTKAFEITWNTLDYRLKVVSGKALVSILNDYLQTKFKLTITYAQIANYMCNNDIDNDLKDFFEKLEQIKNIK